MTHFSYKKLLLIAFAFLGCVSLSSVARGEDPARNVSKEQADEARALFKDGVQAQREGDFKGAYEALRKSYNLRRSFDTAANLGIVEFRLERYTDSAMHLGYWLRNYPTSEDPERYARMKEMFQQVRPHVGGVRIEVDVPGANVFIDDEPVGAAPIDYELFVNPGEHEVRADFQGKTTSKAFEVDKGGTTDVELRLNEKSSESGAEPDESQSPSAAISESEESHRRGAQRNWVPAYILGGVTVAALGTSLVFRGLAGGAKRKAEDLGSELPSDGCPDGSVDPTCREINQQVDRLETRATVSNVALIGAAAIGAVTIGYVVYQLGRSPKDRAVTASAAVGPSGGTFTIVGRF